MDFVSEAYASDQLSAKQIRDRVQNAESDRREQEDRKSSELDPRLEATREKTQSPKACRKCRKQRKLLTTTEAPPPATSDQDPISEGCTPTSAVVTPGPSPLRNQPSKKQGRGYKNFMPGNKFQPKAFTQQEQMSTPTSPPRRKRRKRKQKRKHATLFNPCSRKQRMDPP